MILYSRMWRRALAYLIDYIVFGIGAALLGMIAGLVMPAVSAEAGAGFSLLLVIVLLLYYPIMEASPAQATLGKLALQIKVTDLQGERISFLRAVGRLLGRLISSLLLGIGYIIAAFTKRRQALHDKMAGTVVVRNTAQPEEVANTPDAGPISGWDVVIVLLVGFVPIIGMLAAIAIPAYQDYTIRSQVVEGLNLASTHKAAVADTWDAGETNFEAMNSESVQGGGQVSGKYVSSVLIEAGAVRITYGEQASSHIQGLVLTFVPVLDEEQKIGWVCGYANIPDGHEAVYEDHAQFTDVPQKYLPRSCRESAPP